jgi:hypothetical protein
MNNQPRKIDQIIEDSSAVSIKNTPHHKDNLETIGHTYAQIKELQLRNRQWKLKLKNFLVFFKDSNKIILWTLAFVSGLILWGEFKSISQDAQFCAERPELQECKAKKTEQHPFQKFMWVFFNTMPIGILAILIKLADDQVDKPIEKLDQNINTPETNLSKLQELKTTIKYFSGNVDDEAELTTLANAREILNTISFEHQKNNPDFGHITLLQQKNVNLLDDKIGGFSSLIDPQKESEEFNTILDSFK